MQAEFTQFADDRTEGCNRLQTAWKQEQELQSHTDLSFANPDWLSLCQSLGWKGLRCDNADELQTVLDTALNYAGPAMAVIPIDYREYMVPTERLGKIEQTF